MTSIWYIISILFLLLVISEWCLVFYSKRICEIYIFRHLSCALQKEMSTDIFENRLPQTLESLNKTLKSRGGKHFAENKVKRHLSRTIGENLWPYSKKMNAYVVTFLAVLLWLLLRLIKWHFYLFTADLCRYYIFFNHGVLSVFHGCGLWQAAITDGEVCGVKGTERHCCKQPRHKKMVEWTTKNSRLTILSYAHEWFIYSK